MQLINIFDVFIDFTLFRYLIMSFVLLGVNLLVRNLLMR